MNVGRFRSLAADVVELFDRASADTTEFNWAGDFAAADMALVSTGR